jgi:ABC-type transport system involved in multi-copper enzyme maturation permease subunit
MSQPLRQLAAVIRLELKKTFFARRGWWVYLLALAPVGMTLVHTLVLSRLQSIGRPGHSLAGDTQGFAIMFQVYFLRLAIFFGCVGIFSNLFRGEMLEKTLHYYFLTPMRRELLVIGKYFSGLIVTLVLFLISVTASFYLLGRHQGAAWSDFLMHGPGLAQMGSYALVTALGCVGYGAIFLAAGLFIRNPMIPAAAVWVWENLNPFLPAFLKKISVIFYLKSLSPLSVPDSGPFSVLVTDTDPTPAWLAVPGLLVVALAVLTYAAISARRAEISYGE